MRFRLWSRKTNPRRSAGCKGITIYDTHHPPNRLRFFQPDLGIWVGWREAVVNSEKATVLKLEVRLYESRRF